MYVYLYDAFVNKLYMQVYFSFLFFEQGDLYDHESLLKAIKQVDVVISTVGAMQLADQVKIIDAIKEAGNIKVNYFLFFETGLNSRPLVKDGGILFICMQQGTEGIMGYGDLDYSNC